MDAALTDFESSLHSLPRERRFLLTALREAQDALGYVPEAALRAIAAHLRVPAVEVEGVAHGYSELRTEPPAEHSVEVCTGPACWLAGGDDLKLRLAEQLAQIGDGCLVESTGCAFLCARAPVVRVDGLPLTAPGGAVDGIVRRVRPS
jgi:NADH-quinone oxidoreductase subunit E